jgi:hypothetical protein
MTGNLILEAWIPGSRKSNEINWDGVFAEDAGAPASVCIVRHDAI